ncbi:unnamed protein product, partial [Chrysoparadoxa australica]
MASSESEGEGPNSVKAVDVGKEDGGAQAEVGGGGVLKATAVAAQPEAKHAVKGAGEAKGAKGTNKAGAEPQAKAESTSARKANKPAAEAKGLAKGSAKGSAKAAGIKEGGTKQKDASNASSGHGHLNSNGDAGAEVSSKASDVPASGSKAKEVTVTEGEAASISGASANANASASAGAGASAGASASPRASVKRWRSESTDAEKKGSGGAVVAVAASTKKAKTKPKTGSGPVKRARRAGRGKGSRDTAAAASEGADVARPGTTAGQAGREKKPEGKAAVGADCAPRPSKEHAEEESEESEGEVEESCSGCRQLWMRVKMLEEKGNASSKEAGYQRARHDKLKEKHKAERALRRQMSADLTSQGKQLADLQQRCIAMERRLVQQEKQQVEGSPAERYASEVYSLWGQLTAKQQLIANASNEERALVEKLLKLQGVKKLQVMGQSRNKG